MTDNITWHHLGNVQETSWTRDLVPGKSHNKSFIQYACCFLFHHEGSVGGKVSYAFVTSLVPIETWGTTVVLNFLIILIDNSF